MAIDLRAERPCPAGKSLGQVGGLDIAVIGMLDRAEQTVRVAERPDFLDLIRGQDLDIDPDGFGDPGIIHVLVPAVLGTGQTDIGNLFETDILPGFGFQLAIQFDGIFVDLADRITHVEKGQQTGGMPGRSGRQFVPLHENHIRPAFFGKVIERRNADNTAPDHNNTRLRFHRTFIPKNNGGECAPTADD